MQLLRYLAQFFVSAITATLAFVRSALVSPARLAALSVVLVLTATVASAHAQTSVVYVDINNGVDGPPNFGRDGWGEDAHRFLQDALDAADVLLAQQLATEVELWVAQGTYRPDQGANYTLGDRTATFALRNNVEIYGGFDGTEGPLEFELRDWELNPTILDGDLGQNDAVTIYDPQTGELVLEFDNYSDNSIVIVAAYSEVVLPVDIPDNGDFECTSCSDQPSPLCLCWELALNRCEACPNVCDVCDDPACDLTTINNSAVLDGFHIRGAYTKPDAEFVFGGALSMIGASPTIRNCVIRENRNESNLHGVGVALALPIPDQVTMQNLTVRHNRADKIGTGLDPVAGMWIGDHCPGDAMPSVSPATLPRQIVLLGFEIAENLGTIPGTFTGSPAAGGGLFVDESNPTLGSGEDAPIEVTVVNSTIHKNVKVGPGSGIYVGRYNNLRLWNSLVHRNVAQDFSSSENGIAAIFKDGAGEVEIINSTIADNTADTETGGLHLDNADQDAVTVKNSIFWGNTCPPPQFVRRSLLRVMILKTS